MKALIFDYDGVVVLSEGSRFKVIQEIAKKSGFELSDEEISQMVGRSTLTFLHDVFPNASEQEVQQIFDDYEKEYKGEMIINYHQPFKPVVDFILQYKGDISLALASMSTRQFIETVTRHLGILDKFKVVTTREEIMNHKPDPEIYLKTASKLGIEPKECIALEDTKIGAQSGLNAGMKVFAVLNGFNAKEDFEGLRMDGFIQTKDDIEKAVSF